MPPETIELEEIGAPAPATAGERRRAPPVAWVIAVVAVVALVVTSGIAWHLHDQLSGARHRNALETPTTAVRLPRVAVNPDSGTGEFTAHLTTLEGHGLVAIASEGHLRIIDGQHQLVRDIYRDTAVTRPAWSPSGRWLSYGFDNTEVWVTTAEETQAHQVGSVAAVQADTVAWSPVDDTLAMVTAAGVALVSPDRVSSRPLPGTDGASSLAWSPDGRSLAVMTSQARRPRLIVASASGSAMLADIPTDDYLRLAGWRPDGGGVLAWRAPQGSVSGAADGTDLLTIPLSGKAARLTTMLPYRAWLSWSPDRRHIVVVEGNGREASTGKHLAVCDVVAATCQSIAAPAGTVAVDPAWSPDGSEIAYVQAAEEPGPGYGTWMNTRQLWTVKPDGSGAARLLGLIGADWPRWLADGKRLLVIGDENRLLVVGHTFFGYVAERLYQSEFPPGYYYGFVDWSQTLAWHPD